MQHCIEIFSIMEYLRRMGCRKATMKKIVKTQPNKQTFQENAVFRLRILNN